MTLNEDLAELEEEQRALRVTERLHRDTVEETAEYLLYWSLFEAAVLVGMGLFQMRYLKRFLEVRSTV